MLAKNSKVGETTALVTNPFYHAWFAGSISSGSKVHWLNSLPENNCLPDILNLPENLLKSSVIMYICSPSNPHGSGGGVNFFFYWLLFCFISFIFLVSEIKIVKL